MEAHDPSRPGTVVSRFHVATKADVDEAVACARADPENSISVSQDMKPRRKNFRRTKSYHFIDGAVVAFSLNRISFAYWPGASC